MESIYEYTVRAVDDLQRSISVFSRTSNVTPGNCRAALACVLDVRLPVAKKML